MNVLLYFSLGDWVGLVVLVAVTDLVISLGLRSRR